MFQSPVIPDNLNRVVQSCTKMFVGEPDILLLAPQTFGELGQYLAEHDRMAVQYTETPESLFLGCMYTTLCFRAWLNYCHVATNTEDDIEGTEKALRLMQFHVMLNNGMNQNTRVINRVLNIAVLERELHFVNTGKRITASRAFVLRRILRTLQ